MCELNTSESDLYVYKLIHTINAQATFQKKKERKKGTVARYALQKNKTHSLAFPLLSFLNATRQCKQTFRVPLDDQTRYKWTRSYKNLNFQTFSGPITTKVPQATHQGQQESPWMSVDWKAYHLKTSKTFLSNLWALGLRSSLCIPL